MIREITIYYGNEKNNFLAKAISHIIKSFKNAIRRRSF